MPDQSTGHQSFGIGQKAAQSIYYAAKEQAERTGHPVTHIVTINFSRCPRPPQEAPKAFGSIRRGRYDKWARNPRKGTGSAYPPTYFYVFENKRETNVFLTMDEGEEHNVHVHWGLHIPKGRVEDFTRCLRRWMKEATGVDDETIDRDRVIYVTGIEDIVSVRSYCLKGTRQQWAAVYGAFIQSDQGIIKGGRRTGTSKNLSRGARIAMDKERGVKRRIPAKPRRPKM